MKLLEHFPTENYGTCLWVFDLDDTLITTKSGKKFPVDNTDFKWLMKPVVGPGVDIMIYTNQGGIKTEEQLDLFMIKAQVLFDELCKLNPTANMYFVVADGMHTEYRKPSSVGFHKIIDAKLYKKIVVVGDAAGRKGDHSDSDYKFAVNMGAHFLVPEAYHDFVAKVISHSDISAIKKFVRWAEKNNEEQKEADYSYVDIKSYAPAGTVSIVPTGIANHVYILCGRQGSGKSTIVHKMITKLSHFVRLVPYTTQTGTLSKLKNEFKHAKDLPIIIDGTFSTQKTRDSFIDAIKNVGRIPVVIYMNTPKEICKHNRIYREYLLGEAHIPDIAVRKFDSSFERPLSATENAQVMKIDYTLYGDEPDEYFLYYY